MTKKLFLFSIAMVATSDVAVAAVVDACRSSASSAAGVLFSCPAADGDALSTISCVIDLFVADAAGTPIAGIPRTDIWLIGCPQDLSLCGGSGAINATAPTDANGHTTIAGRYAVGGCATGVYVVVQGLVIRPLGTCPGGGCLPIAVRSADITGPSSGVPDLRVNLLDLARMAIDYPSPPQPYNVCIDYSAPFGTVGLQDFSRWATHFSHVCS